MDKVFRSMCEAPEFRVASEGGGKRLIWYPAVFDSLSSDLGGFREKIGRRAFSRTLAEQEIPALFNHNPDNLLGRTGNGTLTLKVDARGLLATVELPDTQLGRDIETWVGRGDLTGGSFSFSVVREHWDKTDDGIPLREIQECRLWDVAPVVMPAYPDTAKGGMAIRAALAAIDVDPDELMFPLMRAALAAQNMKIDDLTRPLLLFRAGVPLDDETRAQVLDIVERLRRSFAAPPTSDDAGADAPDDAEEADQPPAIPADATTSDDAGHPVRLAIRRRQLRLLQLKGGL